MLVKRASEIIRQAKFLAQCENSDFLDFFTTTNILNEVYEEVYQDIITHTKNYLCELDFNGETLLPCDCYQIYAVVNKHSGLAVERAPEAQEVPGCYTIEDQCLRVIGGLSGEYTLKYYPEPRTITCPIEKPIKCDFVIGEEKPTIGKCYKITDDYLIVGTDYLRNPELNKVYKYDLETKEFTETDLTPYNQDTPNYNNLPVVVERDTELEVINKVMVGGEDWTEKFTIENPWITKVEPEFEIYKNKLLRYLVSDQDTMYATYYSLKDDGGFKIETYIFQDDELSLAFEDKNVFGFKKNEDTGIGLLYFQDDEYTLDSWVPDTLLDFPVNIFYTVMEERVALLLASIVGIENEYLKTSYKDRIEQQYYNTLKHDDYSPCRVRNVNPVRRY